MFNGWFSQCKIMTRFLFFFFVIRHQYFTFSFIYAPGKCERKICVINIHVYLYCIKTINIHIYRRMKKFFKHKQYHKNTDKQCINQVQMYCHLLKILHSAIRSHWFNLLELKMISLCPGQSAHSQCVTVMYNKLHMHYLFNLNVNELTVK